MNGTPRTTENRIDLRHQDIDLRNLSILFDARDRIAMTNRGAAVVQITDYFTERMLDLHWEAIALYFTTGDQGLLEAFSGVEINGRELASSKDAAHTCLSWTRG
jgi:hypothetical protein